MVVAAEAGVIIALWPHVQLLHRIHAFARIDAPPIDVAVTRIQQVELGVLPGAFLLLLIQFVIEHNVQRYAENVFEQIGEDMLHPLVVQGKRRVRVDLDQPDAEVLVDHEVKSKKLIAIPAVRRIHLVFAG